MFGYVNDSDDGGYFWFETMDDVRAGKDVVGERHVIDFGRDDDEGTRRYMAYSHVGLAVASCDVCAEIGRSGRVVIPVEELDRCRGCGADTVKSGGLTCSDCGGEEELSRLLENENVSC